MLADAIGESRGSVYACCKRLEKRGRLRSDLSQVSGQRLFFCPMTQEVMTADNHDRIMQMQEILAETIRTYSLPQERDDLILALELQLEQLGLWDSSGGNGTREAWAQELLDATARARKRREVMELLGIRPMRPPERVWALGPQLALI